MAAAAAGAAAAVALDGGLSPALTAVFVRDNEDIIVVREDVTVEEGEGRGCFVFAFVCFLRCLFQAGIRKRGAAVGEYRSTCPILPRTPIDMYSACFGWHLAGT